MRRILFVLTAFTALVGSARADRIIQAPFVTVQTGSVVVVRAPFVNVVVPVRVVYPNPTPTPAPMPPANLLPAPMAVRDNRDIIPTVDVPPGVTPPVVVLPSTDLTPVSPAPNPPTTNVIGSSPQQTVRAMTISEFARAIRPQQGTYDVVLVHPATGNPVRVRFTLPPGSPKTIRLQNRQVQFNYAVGQNVTLRFNPDGRVSVLY
jgi:hypothetical protein